MADLASLSECNSEGLRMSSTRGDGGYRWCIAYGLALRGVVVVGVGVEVEVEVDCVCVCKYGSSCKDATFPPVRPRIRPSPLPFVVKRRVLESTVEG